MRYIFRRAAIVNSDVYAAEKAAAAAAVASLIDCRWSFCFPVCVCVCVCGDLGDNGGGFVATCDHRACICNVHYMLLICVSSAVVGAAHTKHMKLFSCWHPKR